MILAVFVLGAGIRCPAPSTVWVELVASHGPLHAPMSMATPLFDAPNLSFHVPALPFGIAPRDLNVDGRPDLAVANTTSGSTPVLLGPGGGTLGPSKCVRFGRAAAETSVARKGKESVGSSTFAWEFQSLGLDASALTQRRTAPRLAMSSTTTITIQVPGPLRVYCDGASELRLSSPSVRAVLGELERRYAALYRNICDETGAVRPHISVFVNTSHVRDREGLDTKLEPEDVVTILPAVSGG